MQYAAAFLLVAAVASPLHAQAPHLVKDLNLSQPFASSSFPADTTKYAGRIYFAADSAGHGRELWSTDGTEAGTRLVADLVPGEEGSFPNGLTVANGLLLFWAWDQQHGTELWRSDGTAAGTRFVRDVRPGFESSVLAGSIVYKDRLLFLTRGSDEAELWTSDGTAEGTMLLKPLHALYGGGVASFHGLVYFGTDAGLWQTDGTPAGTQKVKEDIPISGLVASGDKLFFEKFTPFAGWELWVSDGTDAGTRMLEVIADGILPGPLVPFSGGVLFAALPDELWISDGTAAGTHLVKDMRAGPVDEDTRPEFITVIGNIALFAGDDGIHGMELWKTDGTEAGTQLVRDVVPGSGVSNPESLTAVDGRIFFSVKVISGDGNPRQQLWLSDGSEVGTRRVGSIEGLDLQHFAAIDGKLFFSVYLSSVGDEPWSSDGSDAGTRMIANVNPEIAASSMPVPIAALGDMLFLGAINVLKVDTPTPALWRTDGSDAGTILLTDPFEGPGAATRSSFFFSRRKNAQSSRSELWKSDGTPGGTVLVKETASPDSNSGEIGVFGTAGDTLLLTAPGGLWRSDGRNAGTFRISNLGAAGFVDVAGRAYFGSLAVTDGTAAGTFAVKPAVRVAFPTTRIPVHAAGSLYYLANDSSGTELWKSDGTADGTVIVATIPPGAGVTRDMIGADRRVFFVQNGALWTSDGTAAGTRSLKKIATNELSSEPWPMAAIGDRIVFACTDDVNGEELWISDGTEAGTRMLIDIRPGNASSTPRSFFSADGLIYFAANDGIHGRELWMTDGTATGTRLVADVEPGDGSSDPGQMSMAGRRLYFAAATLAAGRELWALPLGGSSLSVSDVRVQEPDSGTVIARFIVRTAAPQATTVTVDYATSNATSLAGVEYQSTAGSLSFAPGETEKSIDVVIYGKSGSTNNGAFLLTLRNASGAAIAKGVGVAVIERAQYADLSTIVSLFRPNDTDLTPQITVRNAGPHSANDVGLRVTATPGPAQPCFCPFDSIAPGASDSRYFITGPSGIVTATPLPREADPSPADNAAAWTINGDMATDTAYVPVNGTATVAVATSALPGVNGKIDLESSDPSVLSVPSSIDVPSDRRPMTFTVRGLRDGVATVRTVPPPGEHRGEELRLVVSSGRPQRWPGALHAVFASTTVNFSDPCVIVIDVDATAPYVGAEPSGTITISDGGNELLRRAVVFGEQRMSVYLPQVGNNDLEVSYGGDANFVPETVSRSVSVSRGNVTLRATADGKPAATRLNLFVTGSPAGTPTGSVTVSEGTRTLASNVAVTEFSAGVATAEVLLNDFAAGPHTVVVSYSGEARYNARADSLLVSSASRRRAAGH